jgi:tyrosyl-tRNA synthetase
MLRYIDLLSRGARGLDPRKEPMAAKQALAAEIVARFHGEDASKKAAEEFSQRFQRRELPAEIPEVRWQGDGETVWLARLIAAAGLAKSNSDARRLVSQGGVRLDGEAVKDPQLEIPCRGSVLVEVGKRRIARVVFE